MKKTTGMAISALFMIIGLGLSAGATGLTNRVLVVSPNSSSGISISDGMQVPHSSSFLSSNVTIEAWLYKTQTGSPVLYVFDKGSDMITGSTLFYSSSSPDPNMSFDGGVKNQFGISGIPFLAVSTGQWYHVAITWNNASGQMCAYFNERCIAAGWVSSFPAPTSTDPVFIGRFKDATYTYNWHGYMDEVRFWNRALSQSEIVSNMYQTVTGAVNGLVASWNFDDGTANDVTTNGHNGTFLGAATTAIMTAPWNIPAPTITNATPATTIGMTFPSSMGITYRLQYSTILASNNWYDTGAYLLGTGDSMTFYDPLGYSTSKFYRVVGQQ